MADASSLDVDRVQGNFLLAAAYASQWVTRGNTTSYTPQPPIGYAVWELLAPKLGAERLGQVRLWEDPTLYVDYRGGRT